MNIDPQKITLLFGVGATKAGTSWLHSQLLAHPECHMRSIKELHYFSLAKPAQFERALKVAEAEALAARQKSLDAVPGMFTYAAKRAFDLIAWCGVLKAGLGAHDRYLDYLQQDIGSRHVIGELTPGYSLLSGATLTMMSRLTSDVRFVYLMRDPVDRLWSHVRMVTARADRANFAAGSLKLMAAILGGEVTNEIQGILRRGDYCAVLDRLGNAVPSHQRLTVYYEDMFVPVGMKSICDFLGIQLTETRAELRLHAGVPLTLTEDLTNRARVFLQPQYQGVQQRMSTIPLNWAANLV